MFFDFALIMTFNLFFSSVSKSSNIGNNINSTSSFDNVFNGFSEINLFLILMIIIVLRFLSFYLHNLMQNKIVVSSTKFYFNYLLKYFINVSDEEILLNEYKLLNSLLLKDLRSFSQTYLLLFLDQILQFSLLLFFIISLLFLTKGLTIFFLIFILTSILIIAYFKKVNIKYGGLLLNSDSNLADKIMDSINTKKTLYLDFKLRDYLQKKVLITFNNSIENISKIAIFSVIPHKIIESLIFIFFTTLLIFINYGYISIIDFTLFSIVLIRLVPVINRINTTSTKINNTQKIAEVINEFILKQNIFKGINNINFTDNIKSIDLHLNLYEKGKYLVDNMVFSIGKTYFIHGSSGFGKTTLIDTFVGYRKPYKGKVLIDNVNFEHNNRLSNVVYLDQKASLMHDSITENILLGNIYDEQKFIEISSILELDKIFGNKSFNELSQSSINELSGKLSGGEIQRILLARALYNFEYLIILDEATNALDTVSELYIVKNVLNYINKKNGMLIFISHNLNLANFFDNIIDIKQILKPYDKQI
jgi:ATP-binding cassette subfamily C protein